MNLVEIYNSTNFLAASQQDYFYVIQHNIFPANAKKGFISYDGDTRISYVFDGNTWIQL